MELAPCPFCGHSEFVTIQDDMDCDMRESYWVVCDYNMGGCGSSSGWRRDKEKAVALWNRSRKLYAPSDEKLTKDDEEFAKIFDLDNWF